jgi:hypothetical protein
MRLVTEDRIVGIYEVGGEVLLATERKVYRRLGLWWEPTYLLDNGPAMTVAPPNEGLTR